MQNVQPSSEPISSAETNRLVREAVQAERERIVQALHATVCQEITGTYLMASAVALQCRQAAPEIAEKLNGLADRLQQTGNQLHLVMRLLEPGHPDAGNQD